MPNMELHAQRLETKELVGESYELPLNSPLNREFIIRGDEIDAIRKWAREAGVALREEMCISHTPKDGTPRCRILTYSYKPQPAKAPAPQQSRKFCETLDGPG